MYPLGLLIDRETWDDRRALESEQARVELGEINLSDSQLSLFEPVWDTFNSYIKEKEGDRGESGGDEFDYQAWAQIIEAAFLEEDKDLDGLLTQVEGLRFL